MTASSRYRTPAAFKVALEDRLKRHAKARDVELNRVRQRFLMERLLARVVTAEGPPLVLKGGLALELRLTQARSTRDVDLRAEGDPEALLARLAAAGAQDAGDYLAFTVELDPEQPDIDDARYGGRRFRVVARLGGQSYGGPFGLDVGMADPMHGAPDALAGEDYLDFVAVPPLSIAAYPPETHIAEKLHAYTRPFPTGRTNSRVRDLPDLALLATVKDHDAATLRAALETTFAFRRTHALPATVPAPPPGWDAPYRALATEHDLAWPSLAEVTTVVTTFLNPVLTGTPGTWSRALWQWLR